MVEAEGKLNSIPLSSHRAFYTWFSSSLSLAAAGLSVRRIELAIEV